MIVFMFSKNFLKNIFQKQKPCISLFSSLNLFLASLLIENNDHQEANSRLDN